LEWKYLQDKFNLTVRSALVDQFLHYTNDSIYANHQSYSWTNRIRASYTGVKNLSIKPGADINIDWVISDAYEGIKSRTTLSAFAECTYDILKKAEISLVFRQDMIDGSFLPFIPALGVEYKPFNKINLSFSGNVSRNYRYPTLNDLYWEFYGNPDLEPETDYAAELGTVYNYATRNKKLFIEAQLSGYYSLMDNLIVWEPVEGDPSKWKPINVRQVLARGIETGLNLTAEFYGFSTKWNSTYNFCRSTYEKTFIPDDKALGKQQIYIPEHTFNTTLSIAKWNFYLSFNNTYVGRRYTSTTNATYMPAYDLSNLIFGKNFHWKKFILSLQLQINNLFDLDYQSIANRPMPGRNYALTLKCNFKD
jgi:iron complex outermembrane receptor protein